LKSGKRFKLTSSQVLQKTGELMTLRHLINLRFDLLNTPDWLVELKLFICFEVKRKPLFLRHVKINGLVSNEVEVVQYFYFAFENKDLLDYY
jgi:hypothetical protein